MQTVFLDVTTEQLSHNRTLQSYMESRNMKPADQKRYIRIPLQNKSVHALQNMLTRITIEECVYWVLRTKQNRLFAEDPIKEGCLQEYMQVHISEIMPQLEKLISQDIKHFAVFQHVQKAPSWNVEGYLRFSAKLLKRKVETALQAAYQDYRNEQERADFIALLQFCVAVQPCILDDVYLTLYADRFTMMDFWGNDLQQIYLEALPKEEYMDVQMHDLILSILMTLLPKSIHLFIAPMELSVEEQKQQEKLIDLLQQIFTDRILIEHEKNF